MFLRKLKAFRQILSQIDFQRIYTPAQFTIDNVVKVFSTRL